MFDENTKAELARVRFVLEALKQASAGHLFGKITVVFENGTITRLIKEESILPPK